MNCCCSTVNTAFDVAVGKTSNLHLATALCLHIHEQQHHVANLQTVTTLVCNVNWEGITVDDTFLGEGIPPLGLTHKPVVGPRHFGYPHTLTGLVHLVCAMSCTWVPTLRSHGTLTEPPPEPEA